MGFHAFPKDLSCCIWCYVIMTERYVKSIFCQTVCPSHLLKSVTGTFKNIRRCSVKKVFLRIPQTSQENTCARVSFLIKLKALHATLLKETLRHRCFPVNFSKFLRTFFFLEHLHWLLLNIQKSKPSNKKSKATAGCKT